MKKNISYINLNTALGKFLLGKLKQAPCELEGCDELSEALGDLLSGHASTLMIELGDEQEFIPSTEEIRCGELVISPKSRRVVRGETEITLTPKEFDILLFLARNRGEVFTKEQIYEAVWDGIYMVDDSNIMAFIRKLRKKVERFPDSPEYILTIWGIGYKFTDKL